MTINARPQFNDEQTHEIIGAGMAVHTALGCGFLETVYRAALAIELSERGIPFRQEVRVDVSYRGHVLPLAYRVDFVCFSAVVVEVKALRGIGSVDEAQVINYLRATNLQRGLLLNFGSKSLQHKRLVWGLEDDPLKPQVPNP